MREEFTKILRLTFSVITLTVLIGILMPAQASAATLTVPDNYGTIQEAINAASNGDTVYVKSGTYYEHLTINKPIVLQGEDKSTTIIEGSGSGNVILINYINNVVISDVTVKKGQNGIYLPGSKYNTIKNIIVSDNTGNGIDVSDKGSQYNTLQNVEAHSNYCGVCAYWGSDYLKIIDSNIHDNTECGIVVGWSYYVTIENTVIHSNGRGIGIDWGNYATVKNCRIYNNIGDNIGEGIVIWGGTRGNNVTENQIYDNKIGIKILDYFSHYDNIFFHNDIKNEKNIINEGSWVSIWNKDYPIGGNYYSDYTGSYLFSGSDQNVAGSDGIGDSAYNIIKNNIDRYPLMKPWHSDFPYQPSATNQPPVAKAGGPYQANEGSPVTFDASSSSDPDGDVLQYRWDFGSDGTWETEWSNEPTIAHTWNDDWSGSVKLEVSDGKLTSNDTATVTISNANPVVKAGNDQSNVKEGDTITFSGSYTDAGSAETHTISWDFGDGSTSNILIPTHVYADNGVYTATLTVTDDDGGVGTDTVTVTVNNANPSVGEIAAPMDPAPVNTKIATSCTFTDVGLLDTHSGVWDWGDGTSPGVISEANGAGTITGEHLYADPGVYRVTLTVTDDDGGSSSVTTKNYVVIYNPEGGFVTGGGWINSPAGAYVADDTLEGKATFGFVSKYEKGATVPTGKTEFQFKVADLNFKSTSYDWLVVAGPKAKYKGTGTINGEGNYGFMLSAVDGAIKGDGIDKFRIKIWDKDTEETIYDNEIGSGVKIEEDVEPSTVISGGSIVVHKEK